MKLEPGAVDVDPESGKTFPADNSVAAWARQNNIHERPPRRCIANCSLFTTASM
ncbi:MAG: hypothetical protein IPM76_03140 [Chloroflexi bacterium]|nr:hypothetical protein [Chloroflexota bacterium]